MIVLGVKAKPYGCSYLAALTPKIIIAQPEGGDTAERLRRGSANRAE